MTAAPSQNAAAPASAPGLNGSELVLSFEKTAVVNGVSLRLRAGQVTALVGPNGSGKSTLLRGLARLHPLDAGTVTLGGDGVGDSGEAASAGDGPDTEPQAANALSARDFAKRLTLFAQSRTAPQGLSVRDVVGFGRHPYRRRFAGHSEQDRAAIQRALEATGVASMAHRAAGELSGGELQRVWLAACLAQETGVVLLDEPTNHLDLRFQVETLDLIRDLAQDRGAAVGVVLHDLDHAARVADELVLLAAGRVVAAGHPLDVLTAANIRAAYGIDVEVSLDERGGRLRIDALGRHPSRLASRPTLSAPPTPTREAIS